MLNSTANKMLKKANRRIARTATTNNNNIAAKELKARTKKTISGNEAVVKKAISTTTSVITIDLKEQAKHQVNNLEEIIIQ